MNKAAILSFAFLLFSSLSYTQSSVWEARKAFYSGKKDLLKHAAFLRDFYLDESPDSIYAIGSFLIKTGITQENLAYVNYGKHIISRYYFEHGKTDVSLRNLRECRVYYERKRDLENLADAQNMTGLAYMYRQQEKEAVHWFLESLKTAQKLPEDSESYMAQFNLSEAFYRLEDYTSAEKELSSFIDKVKRQKLDKGLRRAYDLMGKICFATERAADGLDYYLKSVKLAYKNGDKLGLSFAKNDLAIAYFQLGEATKAKQAFEHGLQLRREINKPAQVCESYFNLGECYYSEENYPVAIAYYDSCAKLAADNSLLTEQADALERMGECYKLNGQFERACELLEQFASVQRAVLSQSKKDAFHLSEDLENFRPGEQQIRQRERERKLQERIAKAESTSGWMLVLSIVVCLLALVVVFKRSRIKG